jgi:hypothetical protein
MGFATKTTAKAGSAASANEFGPIRIHRIARAVFAGTSDLWARVTRPPAATNSNTKSETRNPKSKTSSKSEIRMSKTHARTHAATLLRVLDRSIVFRAFDI